MKRASKAIVVGSTLALALAMAGCGNDSTAGTGTSGSSSRIAIGVKVDQPGTTLKVGNDYVGFDADVARYVAAELGYQPNQIDFKEAVSAQRESMIEGDQVKLVVATYSITDARKQRVSFAGPYFVAGQDLLVRADDTSINGPEDLNGKRLCSVTGSTPAQRIKEQYAQSVDLTEMANYSTCVQSLSGGQIDAVTTDNVILAGYAAQSQYAGKLKLVGKPFSTENYGIGLKLGDTALCQQVTDAVNKMISSGAWQEAIEKNLGASGFQIDTTTNPPTPAPCA